MNLYPKNLDELTSKLAKFLKQEENEQKLHNILNWQKWLEEVLATGYKLKYHFKDNEFLKEYCDVEGKYALQVWMHSDVVDTLKSNLITNHYSEYNDNNTETII